MHSTNDQISEHTVYPVLKNILGCLLPTGIAFYLIYPLLSGQYLFPFAEYEAYKSFMINFVETLRAWELPQWNTYVGSGHPALYFGHYPISLNTPFYMLFGYGDFAYYFTKFIGIAILLVSFIQACRYLGLGYFTSLIGGLVYFSVNFVTRFLIYETHGYLLFLFPFLMVWVVKIIDQNKIKDILIFSLIYIFWLSGGSVTFHYMNCVMLSVFYLTTVFVFHGVSALRPDNLKKFSLLYFILFIVPWLAVLYQYYFTIDVIVASKRLKEGLVVSPFDPVAWRQFMVSLKSSSYFLVGSSMSIIYVGLRLLSVKLDFIRANKIKMSAGLSLILLLASIVPIACLAKKTSADSGENIVANGEFDVNVDGLTPNRAIITVVTDVRRNALQVRTDQDAPGQASIAIPTSVGMRYEFSFYSKKGTAPFGQVKIGATEDDSSPYYSEVVSNAEWKKSSGSFQARTPITYISFFSLAPVRGQTVLFDSVEIYQANHGFIELCKKVAKRVFGDYLPILKSEIFLAAFALYVLTSILLLHKKGAESRVSPFLLFKSALIVIIYVSLLSYYFYSPENIIEDVDGYDYKLFRELSPALQGIFTFCVLFATRDYRVSRIVRSVVFSAIVLYFVRSHLTIPLLRFAGVVWYATRDGSIFSFFFAILFMFGLKGILYEFSNLFRHEGSLMVRCIRGCLLLLVLVLVVRDSFEKFYKGTSHRYIYGEEKWIHDGRKDAVMLNNKLLELNREATHFYRIFTPENHYLYLAGNLQDRKVYEAFIYESCVSKELQDFFHYTILGKSPDGGKELNKVIPYFLYTKHVHAGLGLRHNEIVYRDFYMYSPNTDGDYIQNNTNMGFLWDLMQVKYIIVGAGFGKAIEAQPDHQNYRLVDRYNALGLSLYEIVKDKSYSRFAVLPLEAGQSYDEMISKLNSKDVDILKMMYSKLVFLDPKSVDHSDLKNFPKKRSYKIDSEHDSILIDFESWHRNWSAAVNGENKKIEKAFQMFKGIELSPGVNNIVLNYNLKYFKELFVLSIVTILAYVTLLVYAFMMKNESWG